MTLTLLLQVVYANPPQDNGTTSSSGDVGNGGGRSAVMSGQEFALVSPHELIKRPMTVSDFVRIDEMAAMGDVGNGGGVGRWIKRLRLKISRRLNGANRPTNLNALNGRSYNFKRQSIPLQEFDEFELPYISRFVFKAYGTLRMSEVYSIYLKPQASQEGILRIKDIYALELLDGTILLATDISEADIVLYFEQN
jgi:hypothetical protein